jgi:hypothetical protein
MMNCKQCQEKLSEFIDNCLSHQEKTAMEGHLAQCGSCSRELQQLSSLVQHCHQCDCLQAPEYLHAKIMGMIGHERSKPKRGWIFGSFTFGTLAATAALATFLVRTPNLTVPEPMRPVNALSSEQNGIIATAKQTELPGNTIQTSVRPLENSDLERANDSLPSNLFPQSGFVQTISYQPAGREMAGQTVGIPPKPLAVSAPIRSKAAWSGDYSRTNTSQYATARTAAEVTSLWALAGLKSEPIPVLQPGKEMLIGIFLGPLPGRGYDIRLLNTFEQNERTILEYSVLPPNKIQKSITTRPYAIFIVPHSPLASEFVRR